MPNELSNILEEYHRAIEAIFLKKLERVVLYGSYARGDYHTDSDIDFMILADVPPENVWKYADPLQWRGNRGQSRSGRLHGRKSTRYAPEIINRSKDDMGT